MTGVQTCALPILTDPATGRLRVREVNVDSDSYKVARKYMVRLERADFAEVKSTSRLALIGKMSREEFEHRFKYLTDDPPVRPSEGNHPNPTQIKTTGKASQT